MSGPPQHGLSFSTWPPGAFERLTLIVEAFLDVSAPLTRDDMVRLRSIVHRTELPNAPDKEVETLLQHVLDGIHESSEYQLRILKTHIVEADRRGESGDPAGALTAYPQLLEDLERVLGPDHPDTLDTRYNLAYWQGEAGDPAGALIAGTELLTALERVLGPDHPDTLATRGNLARWRGEAGGPAGAATSYAKLLTDLNRVFGPDDPDTLAIRGNLARWQAQAGDTSGMAAIPGPRQSPRRRDSPAIDDIGTDEEILAVDKTVRYFNDGDIVEGIVVKVDRDEVLLDIGYKTEGVIPANELSNKHDVDPGQVVQVGERIEALVLQKEDKEGRPLLSKKRAQYERAWGSIEKIKEEDGVVMGTVIEVVKTGLVLDIGLRGFLPASLVEMRRVRDLQPYIGRQLEAKIIELDKNRNRVVLSRRAWLEQALVRP